MRSNTTGEFAVETANEMERMHEWYCTSTRPDVEKSLVCISWRMRLKTLSQQEREKLHIIMKEQQDKRHAELQEATGQFRRALKSGNESMISKARTELDEVREHGRDAFDEMRRSWCEEGEGKDLGDASPVCKRWREDQNKSEL